jgi:hypothetical protein
VKEHIEGYDVDTLEIGPDYSPPRYSLEIAGRVKLAFERLHPGWRELSIETHDGIISEALCQIAKDIRCGKEVEVEYLGVFRARDGVLTTHTNRDVVFEPEPLLIERWPVELERVA